MKVVHLCKVRGISGAEKYLLEILPAMQAKGIDVEMICIYEPHEIDDVQPFIDSLKGNKVVVRSKKITRPISWSLMSYLLSSVRKSEATHLHTHLIHADVWGALLKLLMGKSLKVISTKHGYQDTYDKDYLQPEKVRKNGHYWSARLVDRIIDRTFAISNGLMNFYVKAGISSSSRISVVHYGFDFVKSALREDKRYDFGSPQLIIIGRLIPLKGHELVFPVIQKLTEKYPEISLVIVGIGTHEKYLKNKAKRLNIANNVKFLGYRKEVLELMFNSDIVLVPSSAEGFGLVVLEGFKAFKPVIAFDVPGCNEIVKNDENGYLIRAFDLLELEEKIEFLISNPSKAAHLGRAGNKLLHDYFNLDRMVNDTILQYNSF